MVTNAPHFPFDSWTDPYSNNTVLLLRHQPGITDLNYGFVTQLVAHEMAIYFDSRSWPGSLDWNRMPSNGTMDMHYGTNLRSIHTSLANPLIANVFAFPLIFPLNF